MKLGSPPEVTETVYFHVSITSAVDEEGRWFTWGLQTGLITSGATQEDSEERSEEAHILLVRGYKKMGEAALADFMEDCGIDYSIGGEDTEEQDTEEEEQPSSASRGFASAA